MKSKNVLRFAGILMLFVCLFGITAGAFGISDTIREKGTADSENAKIKAKISEIQMESEKLDAQRSLYSAEKAFLKADKTKYESDKAAYEILKDSYDAKSAQFEAAKAAGQLDSPAIAQTQKILDDGTIRLKAAKAKLNDYERAQAFVAAYDALQSEVDTGLTLLSQDKAVSDKIADGTELINAVSTALDEKFSDDSKKYKTALYLCAASILAALLAAAASSSGLRAAAYPKAETTKKASVLCTLCLILSFFAALYGATSGFLSYTMLIAALTAESAAAIFLLSASERFRKAAAFSGIAPAANEDKNTSHPYL